MADDAARMQKGLERNVDEGKAEEAGRGKEEEGGGITQRSFTELSQWWLLANTAVVTAACIKMGRPQTAKRAIEQVEQRLSKDGWPEYYAARQGDISGSKRGSTTPGASQDIW
ncbi:hypothetical protein Pyn_01146 [Prunus yedoensis var. nudiflora]|uniref:Uncharacterized protein n=1 Tax=Prunus yedoensis var. nudiflora TaxID=2094558 RepID=A0A314XUH9_PRUYE|nr:hypothetical protein Pyn_01146 [Prunus yedoensis var. nudiflora]